jgi:iron complex outermembrane receptor protein
MDLLETQALYFNIVCDVNDTSLPVRVNNAGQNDRDIYNLAAKVSYEGDDFTATSITSYDTLEEILTGDAFDFLPIPESFFFNLFESIFGPATASTSTRASSSTSKRSARSCASNPPPTSRCSGWSAPTRSPPTGSSRPAT